MRKSVFVSLYLDTRFKRKTDLYSLKLRVYHKPTKKTKLYSLSDINGLSDIIKTEYQIKEYKDITEIHRNKRENKEILIKFNAIIDKINELAKKVTPFTFEAFEHKLFGVRGNENDVFFQYETAIQEMISSGHLGNADVYKTALKSLKIFFNNRHPELIRNNKLLFPNITTKILNEYEQYLVIENSKSYTTVSMYLRTLRAIFNRAIKENEELKEVYPFGKGNYQIPAVKRVKKALSNEQLKVLFEASTKDPNQEKARDFWFFSFVCNGMNINDIAKLKYKNIDNDVITFYRGKTIHTTKANLKPITVYLNDFSLKVIERYGNENTTPEQYVFNIINNEQTQQEQKRSIKAFTRFINQHLKKLAVSLDLPKDISTNWARHSFATASIRKGASIEMMAEMLGHHNTKTTEGYFAGFENMEKKKLVKTILNF